MIRRVKTEGIPTEFREFVTLDGIVRSKSVDLQNATSWFTSALHDQVQNQPGSIDFNLVKRGLELLRDVWLKLDRYAGAVRSATVGIEAIANIDRDGVRELNEYVEHVADTTSRLHERFEWASSIIQDYATALAQRQGEQINRLAVVSMIFPPISFLTGISA